MIGCDSRRPIKLSLIQSIRPEAKLELSVTIKYLNTVIVEVSDRNVTIRQTRNILWTGEILILVAKIAKAVQELALTVKDADTIGLAVRYDDLILVVLINTNTLGTKKLSLANFRQKLAILLEYIDTFKFVIDLDLFSKSILKNYYNKNKMVLSVLTTRMRLSEVESIPIGLRRILAVLCKFPPRLNLNSPLCANTSTF